MRLILALFLMTLTLSACANKGLRDVQPNSRGPDEFLVEPKAALQTPSDLASLPTPTPGQSNLTDNDPLEDAVIALGGRADQGTAVGVTSDIRATLAEADEAFRRRQARFTQYRIFSEDLYVRAYQREVLDASETAALWRQAGARTPSYPPSN